MKKYSYANFKLIKINKTIKKDDSAYNDIINDFCNNFYNTFEHIDKNIIEQRIKNNLKKIYIGEIKGFIGGIYFPIKKAIFIKKINSKKSLFHELLHVISNSKNSFSNLSFKYKYLLKNQNITNMDEGITNYILYLIFIKNGYINKGISNFINSYPGKTEIIFKLAQIFGNEIIINSYLGINQKFIDCINKYDNTTFNKLLIGYNEILGYSPQDDNCFYSNPKININQIINELFNKEKIKPINSIEDFKSNTIARLLYNMNSIFNNYYFIYKNEKNITNYEMNINFDIITKSMQPIINSIILDWQKIPNYNNYNLNNILNSCLEELNYINEYKFFYKLINYSIEKNNWENTNLEKENNMENIKSQKQYLQNLKNDIINYKLQNEKLNSK